MMTTLNAARSAPAGYDERRLALLSRSAAARIAGRTGIFTQIARLARGDRRLDEATLTEAIGIVTDRIDSSDFTMAGIVRLLALDADEPRLDADQRERLRSAVRGYKYWWDEPGVDAFCYHTENHQVLFHSCELLAGQAGQAETFPNSGRRGAELLAHARPLLERWMRLRSQVGWSEWLSNTYLEHNVLALANVHDFAADPALRWWAAGLLDVLLVELALHSHAGVFGCSHGRAYANGIVDGGSGPTATLTWLLFGTGDASDLGAVGALALATSGYRPPAILDGLASAPRDGEVTCEQQSFDVDDGARLGLGVTAEIDGHAYWAMQEFGHPTALALTRHLVDTYGLGLDTDPGDYEREYADQLADAGRITDPLRDRHALSAVNVQTYRSADVMLSGAQAYRPGSPGYQHHVWQATLGARAVVFTTHPGSWDLTSRPNWWAGNGVLPHAVQHRDVLICLHRVPAEDPLPFSHAYFPVGEFDEVVRRGGWWLARQGEGYLALWCSSPVDVNGDELRSRAPSAAWVCVVGGAGTSSGGFSGFVETVGSADVGADGLDVSVALPGRPRLTVGWGTPLRVDGEVVASDYPRLDSPYGRVERDALQWSLRAGPERLDIELDAARVAGVPA